MSSILVQRILLAARAGMQFLGKRDMYTVFGYNRTPTFEDLYVRYDRQDIAARIVDLPAEELWNYPPKITVTGNNSTDLQQSLLMLDKKLDLYQQILRADRLCGFGRYAILFLGLPGNPEQAVKGVNSLDDLKYIQAYGENAVRVKTLIKSPVDPRFGLPEMYEIDIGNTEESRESGGVTSLAASKMTVHWTRVIHIAEKSLGNGILGIPRLRPVYNLLDDLLKVAGGSAETYWLTANRGTQVDVDKDMELSTDDANDLSDELEEYQHQLRRIIRTRGVKINTLGSDTPDPRGAFSVTTSLIAAATGIPQRILLGAEAGQLASEQDRANWANTVTKRRTEFAERVVLSGILRHLSIIGILPNLSLENVTYSWPDAFHLSPLEAAQTMAQKARAISNLTHQNQTGGSITSVEEARRIVGLPDVIDGELIPPPPTPSSSDTSLDSGGDSNVDTGNGSSDPGSDKTRQEMQD